MANTGLPVLGDVAVKYRGTLKVIVRERKLRLPVEHIASLLAMDVRVTFLDKKPVDQSRLVLPADRLPFPDELVALAG